MSKDIIKKMARIHFCLHFIKLWYNLDSLIFSEMYSFLNIAFNLLSVPKISFAFFSSVKHILCGFYLSNPKFANVSICRILVFAFL